MILSRRVPGYASDNLKGPNFVPSSTEVRLQTVTLNLNVVNSQFQFCCLEPGPAGPLKIIVSFPDVIGLHPMAGPDVWSRDYLKIRSDEENWQNFHFLHHSTVRTPDKFCKICPTKSGHIRFGVKNITRIQIQLYALPLALN